MIRFAVKEDLPFITEIYNEEILKGTATFDLEPKSLEDRIQWFNDHGENHPIIVYETEGQVVGYASLSPYRPKKAYDSSAELSIYIHKDYQGKGIGSKLMEAILKLARENKKLHTIISVITAENEVSCRFHEKFGFTNCGCIREVGYKFGRFLDIVTYQLIL